MLAFTSLVLLANQILRYYHDPQAFPFLLVANKESRNVVQFEKIRENKRLKERKKRLVNVRASAILLFQRR